MRKKSHRLLLLADADLLRRTELKQRLTKAGFNVVETSNAIMAAQLADQKHPDLILLSTRLELQTVQQLCRGLRRNAQTKQIPLVVYENKRQAPAMQKLIRKTGIDAYIRYPAASAQILPVLHNLAESLGLQESNSSLKENVSGYVRQLRAVNESAGRFVPSEFLNLLGKTRLTDLRHGDWKQVRLAILFADIRGFTSLSETMTPEENFRFINSYLSRMGPIIRRHRGFIDKYIGDGIMAIFPRSARNALDAAIAMQKEMQLYNRHRAKCGYAPVRIGIGIHFGDTIIGTIGENERVEVTVISDAVNVASRLESLSKRYGAGILVSNALLSQIPHKGKYNTRFIDRVRARGKQSPLDIIEVLDGLTPEEFRMKRQNRPVIQKALKAYLANHPSEAAGLLLKLGERLAPDKAGTLLRDKIQQFIALPEEARGDTIETLYE